VEHVLILDSRCVAYCCCSNLYYANPRFDKRQWQYIVGGVAFLAVLVPDFGQFRSGAFIAVITTTITSIYLLVAALSLGQVIFLFTTLL
jgi:auxin influx carrier (AUX1 LAX family)